MPPTEEDLAWIRSTFHPIPKPQLPDDCVEYSLYVISSNLDANSDAEFRLYLRDVQKAATELQKKWLKNYIWQRQGFGLEMVKEDGISLLRGRTEYGDSVEDEWVVVWLLRELSKHFADLWVKIVDGDGEFLLIEAAGTLPKWLEPEVAENRVWIHGGSLTIIRPLKDQKVAKRQAVEKLSLSDARRLVLHEPKQLLHSASIEEEAFYRLRNYPQQIADNMHHALVRVPRTIAFLLHQKPAYIAPAIEAFYLRDPIALKPLQIKDNANLVFVPEDLVTVSVRFPRVGYGQLRSQDFPAPVTWAAQIPATTDAALARQAETGMKISCGFEMLVSDTHNQDKPAVREIKMFLDDLNSGDEALPDEKEIAAWDHREDDEKWLDISFEDLETELAGKEGKGDKKRGIFGDRAAQENLQRIVAQFEEFLNDDKAGLDGAGLFDEDSDAEDSEDGATDEEASSSGEDQEASFDEDEFTKMMQEMMGMPSEVMQEIMGTTAKKGTASSLKVGKLPKESPSRIAEVDSDHSDQEEDEDMQSVMQRMEAELNETGVLNLEPTPRKIGATTKAIKGKGKATNAKVEDSNDSDSDDGEENDIDVNLARNLLESLQSHPGAAGPSANLMGLMGMKMPRDEGSGAARSHVKE